MSKETKSPLSWFRAAARNNYIKLNSAVLPIKNLGLSNTGILLIYIVIALCLVEAWHSGGGKFLGTGDAPTFVWYFKWWPWALIHHRNPLVTHLVWFPSGEDLAWATSIPSLSLFFAPLTLLTSPVFAYNVCSLMAPALAAWTAFLLFKNLTNDTLAALFGGYFFGFSSYELAQMLGHLNLDTIFIVPVLVLVAIMKLKERMSRSFFLVLFSLLLVLQFGISIEVFATAGFFGVMSIFILFLFDVTKSRKILVFLFRDILVCFMITMVVVSPWLWEMWKGHNEISAQFNSPLMYSSDALNFVLPTAITRFGGADLAYISKNFTGNISEQGAYIGIFGLMILLFYFIQYRRNVGTRALFFIVFILMICSLGPQLQIDGHHTGVPLPWWIGMHLPLIRQALPARFSMYVSLVLGLVVALWLAASENRRSKVFRLSVVVIAGISLLPSPSVLGWTKVVTPPFFKGGKIDKVLGPSPNVMILPYAYFSPGMLWQVRSDMAFTQSGGYLGYVPRQFAIYRWPIVGELLNGSPAPSFERDLTSFCRAHHVTAVLVTPGARAALVHAIDALSWQSFRSGGVEVFRVPEKPGTKS